MAHNVSKQNTVTIATHKVNGKNIDRNAVWMGDRHNVSFEMQQMHLCTQTKARYAMNTESIIIWETKDVWVREREVLNWFKSPLSSHFYINLVLERFDLLLSITKAKKNRFFYWRILWLSVKHFLFCKIIYAHFTLRYSQSVIFMLNPSICILTTSFSFLLELMTVFDVIGCIFVSRK